MDYTIETNDEEPLLRLNIKEQAEKKIREQKFIRNKSTKVNIYLDDDRYILDCEANDPVVVPKEFDLYYKSVDGQYLEDEAGYIPFNIAIVEEKNQDGETKNDIKILYGSLNKFGEVVIKPIYTTPVIFFNDAIARTARWPYAILLNHFGEEVALSYLNTEEFEITAPLDKEGNLFIAKSIEDDSCFGVVRYDKKIIVALSNKTIYKNTGDYIWALKGDTLSIYNNEGKWVKSIRYVDLGEIELRYRNKHEDYVFVHKEAVAVRVSGYWGVYDFDGDVKIPHIYKLLDAYWVYSDYDYESGKEFLTGDGYGSSPLMFVKKKNGGYGIININVLDESHGIRDINDIKEIIPCKYDAIYSNDGMIIEELKNNFFQHEEQDGDGNWVEGIGDDIFFVSYQDNLLECDYFDMKMLSFGKKDKEEHFLCKEFNQSHYIDEDGNPHLREKHRDQSSYDKGKLINTSRRAFLEYSEDGRTIISCNKTVEGELIVPDGVEHIANCAFEDSKVTSLVIPDSVKIIGDCAFSGCSGMTSITIGNGVTNIGNRAFYGCSALTSITIPNSVINIGNAAPIDYSRLALSMANLNKQIAIGAFEDCSGLTSITIGNKVTSIGNRTFCGCHRLTSVTIPNSVTSIGDKAFKSCSDLVSVMIPNSVKSIGDYAFEGCDRLTSIMIPNSVTRIGYGAFFVNLNIPDFLKGKGFNFFHKGGLTYPLYNATLFACMPTLYNKSSYIIPDGIKEICGGAFNNCSALVSVIIPNSVTKIGDRAFYGCSGLTSIEIPNSVKTIGHGAFDECFRLTSVTIPNSVISIGEGAFHDCSGLTSPVHNATLFAYMPTSYCGSYNIPDGIKEICGGAFWCCRHLTSVAIPNSVTSIGDNAFGECNGLTSITIPNSVMSIGDSVFRDCDNLKEIIIPKGTKAKFEELLPDQKDKLVEQEEMTNKETMDRILYFDTETTGVPLNYKAPSSDTNNWPRLVQLAWILTDEEGTRIHTGNLVIKPDGFVIPADATKVHGITTQRAKEEGVPLAEAIEQFKADLDMATYIVGHNIEFDKKIVGAEMIRLGMKDDLEKKKSYCTMQSSIDFCKIPGKFGYKYPKLQELYRKLFGEVFEDAHDAASDIEATQQCFWELRKKGLI